MLQMIEIDMWIWTDSDLFLTKSQMLSFTSPQTPGAFDKPLKARFPESEVESHGGKFTNLPLPKVKPNFSPESCMSS